MKTILAAAQRAVQSNTIVFAVSLMSAREKAAIFGSAAFAIVFVAWLLTYGIYPFPVRYSQGPNEVAGGIFERLPADAGEANAQFRAWVLSHFPPQTSEATMIQALSALGFVSDGWFGKRMTFRRIKGGGSRAVICDFTGSVTWESDELARIKTIDARFLRTFGCNVY